MVRLVVFAFCLLPSALSAEVLSGTVKSIDGAPVAGASVVVEHGGRTERTTADAAGAFSFPNVTLPALVVVSAPGFATSRQLVERSPAQITLRLSAVRESVVVMASEQAVDQRWRDPRTGGTELTRADLDLIPSVTADEAIRVIPGFSLFRRSSSRSSNPTTHGVTLRGLSASGASRGLVLLEGVPLNDGFGGWVTWTRLPGAAIGRVEIDRGAEGDAFGSDALGGVINFVSPTVGDQSFAISAETGTTSVGAAEVAAGARRGRWSMFGASSVFHTDGVIPLAPESRGTVDERADADWVNGFGRAAVSFGSRRLVVSGWGGRDDRGNGTKLQRNRMSGGTAAVAFESMGAATRVAARVSFTPNSFYQTFTNVASGRATETLTSTQFIDTTTTRAIGEVGRALGGGYVVGRAALSRASADFTDRRATSTLSISPRDDSEAVSVHGGFSPLGSMTIGLGARHEWRRAPASTDGRDSATVGHASASWTMAERVVVRASAASSHRWPTLNELVRDFRVGAILTQANPDLQPERARSFDAAVTLRDRAWLISAGVFRTVVDDPIVNVTLTPTLRQRRNAGEARATGAEIDAEIRPAAAFRLRASAAIVDARFRESSLDGKRLPQVPRTAFTLTADGQLPLQMTASGLWRIVSRQFDDDLNQNELASASQIDLRLAGRVRQFGWHVSLENATDARLEVGRTPLVTLAPGRAVRVGVSWRK